MNNDILVAVLKGIVENEKEIAKEFYISVFDSLAPANFFIRQINNAPLIEGVWQRAFLAKPYQNILLNLANVMRTKHITKLDDRGIQKVMREIDSYILAKALKGFDKDTQDKFFRNMSKRAAAMLKEDMDYMGPISEEEILSCQDDIVAVMQRLYDNNEIILS